MIKRILIPLLILFTGSAFGQTDYFVKDSVKNTGYDLVDGGGITNSAFCQVKYPGQIVKYTPQEISEYGFHDGRKFISMMIDSGYKKKRVFLEQLAAGKINLFYYTDTRGKFFYIQKGPGKLYEIRKNPYGNWTFRDELMKYLDDCENIPNPLTNVSYNKNSMTALINQYNTCSRTFDPAVRFGLTGAFSVSSPAKANASEEVLKEIKFASDKTYAIGIFADIPLFKSAFSLHPELYFQKNAYSGTGGNKDLRYDYIINSSSFCLPVLMRYTHPNSGIHPFFDIGNTFCYNFSLKEEFYSTEFSEGKAEIEEFPADGYSSLLIGFSLGAGISFPVTAKKALSVETRYTYLKSTGGKTFGNSGFLFSLAINL